MMRRYFTALSCAAMLLTAMGPAAGAPPRVWLAGDFHVHTTHSHDVCGTPPTPENCHPDDPSEPYTWGSTPAEQIASAQIRGLDFIALTDHNTVDQQSDPGYTSETVTLVNAYENSLPGHAQMLGATRLYGSASTCAGVGAIASELRADGGAFQINHPGDGGVGPGNWARRLGGPACVVPDSVEVWNIGPWVWQAPAPSSNDNDRALRFWESFLDAGHKVAATGGSDNHWLSTSAVQGVGQPTTWVFAEDDTSEAIVSAVKAGRTSISSQPPALGGARLEMLALTPSGIAGIGDTVPRASTFDVRAVKAAGGAAVTAGIVRFVTDGGRVAGEMPLAGAGAADDEVSTGVLFTIPAGLDPAPTWIRAELYTPDGRDARGASCPPAAGAQTTLCANRWTMTAMTSAIYLT